MRSLLLALLLTQFSSADVPRLKSVSEKSYSPKTGQAYGDNHELLLTWELQRKGGRAKDRTVHVMAERRFHSDREDLRYWKARLYPHREKDSSWVNDPRLSRSEFVEILRLSEEELKKRQGEFHFKYVYVSFHVVTEHEEEMIPRLRKALADTPGLVKGKHRGIMNAFHGAFASSEAMALTSRALQASGMNFAKGRMSGDYYTPVDPGLAGTWKDAAKLEGFGLRYPPSIVFRLKEGGQDAGGKPE